MTARLRPDPLGVLTTLHISPNYISGEVRAGSEECEGEGVYPYKDKKEEESQGEKGKRKGEKMRGEEKLAL